VSVEPILLLLVAAVVGNCILMAIIVVPAFVGRGHAQRATLDDPLRSSGPADAIAVTGGRAPEIHDDGVPLAAYDRVVRIVAWTFIIVTSVIIAVTGLWPDAQPAIFVILAVGGGFVLVVHDLLPSDTLGPAKFVVEGSVAITLVTLLVTLTGGAASPFFYAYPLIVAGAGSLVARAIVCAQNSEAICSSRVRRLSASV
jgi:hypothetical protein